MRALAMLLAAAWMAATPYPAAAQSLAAPEPFVGEYDVTYRGMGAGSLTFDFAQQSPGRYVFETRADPSLLARLIVSSNARERSVMQIDATGVRPLEWRLEDGRSSDKRDGHLVFDWDKGRVTGTVEREAIELPTEPDLQDRLSIQIAASTDLMRDETPGTYPLIDDNRVKHYTYSKKESARIDSPLGEIDAVVYESTRPGSSRVSRLWLAPELDYAPVRAEQIRKGKVETVMVMKSYRRTGE